MSALTFPSRTPISDAVYENREQSCRNAAAGRQRATFPSIYEPFDGVRYIAVDQYGTPFYYTAKAEFMTALARMAAIRTYEAEWVEALGAPRVWPYGELSA